MSEAAARQRMKTRNPLVALTGATGFIGRYLLRELPKRGYRLRVLLRRPATLPEGCAGAVIGDLARPYNMAEALAGVDAVIHTAGLAGTMTGVPEDDYRLFNTEATVGFAKAAQRAQDQALRLSVVDQSAIRSDRGGRAHRGIASLARPTPMAVRNSPPNRVSPRPISTGWRSGLPLSTDRASRATWRD